MRARLRPLALTAHGCARRRCVLLSTCKASDTQDGQPAHSRSRVGTVPQRDSRSVRPSVSYTSNTYCHCLYTSARAENLKPTTKALPRTHGGREHAGRCTVHARAAAHLDGPRREHSEYTEKRRSVVTLDEIETYPIVMMAPDHEAPDPRARSTPTSSIALPKPSTQPRPHFCKVGGWAEQGSCEPAVHCRHSDARQPHSGHVTECGRRATDHLQRNAGYHQ